MEFIINNNKDMYGKFGLSDIEIDNFRNYDNIFEFISNGKKNILAITSYK